MLKKLKETMKPIFKKIRNTYRHLFVTDGVLELTAGRYEIFIDAAMDDQDLIEFKIEATNISTCSYLPLDRFEIESREKGFLLKATVESEKVKFIWNLR